MITPVVLILAAGQLILTTSQRLARSVERARKLSDQFEQLGQQESSSQNQQKKTLLYQLLLKAALRSRKLQQALSLLYVALSVFVATSVVIGALEALGILAVWVPVVLGLMGTALMFYATVLLIAETRLALGAVEKEMSYLTKNYRGDVAITAAEQAEQKEAGA
jgi:hypothetical protein